MKVLLEKTCIYIYTLNKRPQFHRLVSTTHEHISAIGGSSRGLGGLGGPEVKTSREKGFAWMGQDGRLGLVLREQRLPFHVSRAHFRASFVAKRLYLGSKGIGYFPITLFEEVLVESAQFVCYSGPKMGAVAYFSGPFSGSAAAFWGHFGAIG